MGYSVSGFDWDDGNLEKCQKHGVSIEEIEGMFLRAVLMNPDAFHSEKEPRFWAIGKNNKERRIFVVFTLRTKNRQTLIRPISARYMHKKEVIAYEKENPDIQD